MVILRKEKVGPFFIQLLQKTCACVVLLQLKQEYVSDFFSSTLRSNYS